MTERDKALRDALPLLRMIDADFGRQGVPSWDSQRHALHTAIWAIEAALSSQSTPAAEGLTAEVPAGPENIGPEEYALFESWQRKEQSRGNRVLPWHAWHARARVALSASAKPDTDARDAPASPEPDDYKAWYDEAMVASNEAGFVGLSAAETIRALASPASQSATAEALTDALAEAHRRGQALARAQERGMADLAAKIDADWPGFVLDKCRALTKETPHG